MLIRTPILIAAVLLMLPALAAGQAPTLSVGDPYVRAVPPGQPNSAAFMTLTNSGDADVALIGAASPAANVVELHTHTMVDGVMRMRLVERIGVPAGAARVLEPGGLHLMLIGLTRALAPGDEVALTLTFDDGSTAHIQAPVRRITPMQMPHRH